MRVLSRLLAEPVPQARVLLRRTRKGKQLSSINLHQTHSAFSFLSCQRERERASERERKREKERERESQRKRDLGEYVNEGAVVIREPVIQDLVLGEKSVCVSALQQKVFFYAPLFNVCLCRCVVCVCVRERERESEREIEGETERESE